MGSEINMMMASNQETIHNANKDLSSLIESVIKSLLESTLKSQKKEIIETFDKISTKKFDLNELRETVV